MRKIVIFSLGIALFASCESSQQMNGLFVGSTLGGVFGSSIGGLMDGPRGADAGRALGMIVGGVAGAAATAPKQTTSASVRTDDTYYSPTEDMDAYNRRSPSTNRKGREIGGTDYTNDLQIENLHFIDANNNHVLEANERAKVVFEIRNVGNRTLTGIAPVVNASDTKRILISPTAVIASLEPGKAVRYTAELYAKKSLRKGVTDFSIGFVTGKYVHSIRRFQLSTDDGKL